MTRAEPYTAAELRMWRAKLNETQANMAKLFGVSQRVYSHWEAGRLPRNFGDRFEAVLVTYYKQETV